MKKIAFLIFVLFFSFCFFAEAEIFVQQEQGTLSAVVERVVSSEERIIPGTEVSTDYQVIEAKILEGEKTGEIVTIENDFLQLKEGERFFMSCLKTADGIEIYSVYEPDRRKALYFFIALFVLAVFALGKSQGLRSLLSLAGSFFIILYFLLPRILNGAPPVLTSIIFSVFILIFAIYVTHGFNKKSSSAVLGTISSVVFTGILAYFAIDLVRLSGFVTDEAVYLNFATGGYINFSGLLLGAIIIGTLGILDDIAITQAACVKEFYKTDPSLSRKDVYKKALVVGRDHVGALVNTLALAYAGAAMPLLLLFYGTETSYLTILNREVFATEIIRTVIGSIGLVLAVPITTLFAVWMLVKKT